MNNKLVFGIGVLFGAVIGSTVTYSITKKNTDKKDQEKEAEIEEIRKFYSDSNKSLVEKNSALSKQLADINRAEKENMLDQYKEIVSETGYTTESIPPVVEQMPVVKEQPQPDDNHLPEIPEPITRRSDPYMIGVDDFGNIDGYTTRSFVYYANGVMFDENYEMVTNYRDILGDDNVSRFQEFEERAEYVIWIRNDDIMTDFEIQLAGYDFSD